MLRATQFGDVTRFDLAKTLAGRGRYWTSAYLVGDTLVDTGCAHSAEELLDALSETPIRKILTTHSHEDHIGAHGLIQRRHPEVEIRAHPLALPVMADPRGKQPLHLYRRVMWGWPQPSRGDPIEEGDEVESGDHVFQALHTPGHALDHLCFFEPDRGWLFTGDLFVGGSERALRVDYDIWTIVTSLKRISSLPTSIMFPGSARVREKPLAEINAKIDYLENLGQRVVSLHKQGSSVRRIARNLCGGPMFMEAITLGHFSRRGLVESFLRQGSSSSSSSPP